MELGPAHEAGDEPRVHEILSQLLRRATEVSSPRAFSSPTDMNEKTDDGRRGLAPQEQTEESLESLVEDSVLACTLFCCASLSDRCRRSVEDLSKLMVLLCNKKEIVLLLTDVLRSLVADECDVSWASLACALRTASSALRGITRKKHLHLLSIADLHVLVCERAARALLAGGQGPEEARDCAWSVGLVVEDASIVSVDLGSSEEPTARRLQLHCLSLLGSVYGAVVVEAVEDDFKGWAELTSKSLEALGVRSLDELGTLVLDEAGDAGASGSGSEDSWDEDEEDGGCLQVHFMGACAVAEAFLDDEVGVSGGDGQSGAGDACLNLMRMASIFLGKMIDNVEGFPGDKSPAAISRALHLLYSFTARIEGMGGLGTPCVGQRDILGFLIRLMSHFPDKPVRMRARFCMNSFFASLRPSLRFLAMAEVIGSCEYPSVKATLLVSLKDEVAAAWPSTAGEAGGDSPFLGRAALDCILGPLHQIERLPSAGEKKDCLEESSEVVVASLNALRFWLLKEKAEGGHKTRVLDEEVVKRLYSMTLPAVRETAELARKDRQRPRGFMSPVMNCNFCAPGDEWKQQIMMNLQAVGMVTQRLNELLQSEVKKVSS